MNFSSINNTPNVAHSSNHGDSSGGGAYGRDNKEEDQKEEKKEEFVDRSAQISATLNSLAVINAVKVVGKSSKREKKPSFSSIKKDINIFYDSKD